MEVPVLRFGNKKGSTPEKGGAEIKQGFVTL
jgi:hypothetical protein